MNEGRTKPGGVGKRSGIKENLNGTAVYCVVNVIGQTKEKEQQKENPDRVLKLFKLHCNAQTAEASDFDENKMN